jgi:hypothetical protein
MAIKIKIKLSQDYGSPEVHKAGDTVEFGFDEAMNLVQAGFGEQVEDGENPPVEIPVPAPAAVATTAPAVAPTPEAKSDKTIK